MEKSSDPLIENFESGDEEQRGSLDVLLQLTLPIVLILAILVTAWMAEMEEAKKLMQGSSTELLVEEMESTILSLQLQLLIEATFNVVEKEKDTIKIVDYQYALPEAGDLLRGDIIHLFRDSSQKLFHRFGTETLFNKNIATLSIEIEKKEFLRLVEQLTAKNPLLPYKRIKLLKDIKDENRDRYVALLRGQLNSMKEDAKQVQYRLVLKWLQDERVARNIDIESNAAWQEWEKQSEGNSQKNQAQFFDNLMIITLEEILKELDIELLSESITALKNES